MSLQSTSNNMTIDRLPEELLSLVLLKLKISRASNNMGQADDDETADDSQMDLANCALVSRKWHRLASTHLYQTPQFRRPHQLDSLIRCLNDETDKPQPIGPMVQSLTFNRCISRSLTDGKLAKLLKSCSNLRNLNLSNCHRLGELTLLEVARTQHQLNGLMLDDLPHRPRFSAGSLTRLFDCRVAVEQLTDLRFYQCPGVDDALLDRVAVNVPLLSTLVLIGAGSKVSERGTRALAARCQRLRVICLTSRYLRETESINALVRRSQRAYVCVLGEDESLIASDSSVIKRALLVQLVHNWTTIDMLQISNINNDLSLITAI